MRALRAAPLAFLRAALLLPASLLGACASGPPPALAPLGPATIGAPLPVEARTWVEETLRGLSLEEKAGQLVSVWIPGAYASPSSPAFEELARLVEEGLGGVSISIGLPHAYAAKLNALQERARVPLLVSSNFESGGPGMRLAGIRALPSLLDMGGGTELPPTMAFGAIGEERFAYEAGRITGREARAVGVHMNFAPVVDVNSAPENPVINTRAFGEDPEEVSRLATAFIRGAHAAGLLTTAKHFPGHGDTRIDSHIDLPVVAGDRARLDSLELVPFRRAIAAGVDGVMSAHIAVPGVAGAGDAPATLSPYFLTGVLREELGFDGVAFTDALSMGAITRHHAPGEAAVLALEAGADVLLSPADPRATIDAVTEAVRSGRLTEARVDASVRRILRLKARAGLHRGRRVDLAAVDRLVGSGPHLAFAEEAAARSITVPRDVESLLPLDPERTDRALAVTWHRHANLTAGRTFDRTLAASLPGLESARLDDRSPAHAYDSLLARAEAADVVLVSVYLPPRSGDGSVAVPDPLVGFVRRLVDRGTRLAVLSFGNPYLVERFPGVGTYLVAWGDRPVSQRAAARAVSGSSPISGRLPVTLPPFHRRGDGLRRPLPAGAPMQVGGEATLGASGVDPDAWARVDRMIRVAIADSVTPGAALAVGHGGRVPRLRGYGRVDWDPASPLVTDSTLYDLASLTKVVGTTSALMRLVEQGRVALDDPVARHLPGWAAGRTGGVTVERLLLHRAGLPSHLPLWREARGREAFRGALAGVRPVHPPGDTTVYSDLGFLALGQLVEEVTGSPLDAYLERSVFGPLGMRDTRFRPDPSLRPRTAPTELDTTFRRAHLRGVVHDENAYAAGGVAGHAGLFGSARDLAVFARALLEATRPGPAGEGGDAAGEGEAPAAAPAPHRPFDPSTVRRFTARRDSASTRALGWDTPGPGSSAGLYLTRAAFGHTGFTGTSLWVDPELDLFVVLLTNRVNPSREERGHVLLRRAVHDAVVRAVAAAPPRRAERDGE